MLITKSKNGLQLTICITSVSNNMAGTFPSWRNKGEVERILRLGGKKGSRRGKEGQEETTTTSPPE